MRVPKPRRRVAVMQPYLFPYVGQYQLARAVDEFVFFDDAAFMKKSYIQRNSILLAGAPHRFSAPIRDASQNRTIAEHRFTGEWQPLLTLMQAAYGRAPMYSRAMPLIESVLRDPDDNVARKNARSMTTVFDYLGLHQCWSFTSALPAAGGATKGQARIVDLCQRLHASAYINPPGGRALYDAEHFAEQGLALRFLAPRILPYAQAAPAFVPHLSIIDLLMHLPAAGVVAQLDAYTVVD